MEKQDTFERVVQLTDDMKLIVKTKKEIDIMTISAELTLINKIVRAVASVTDSNEVFDDSEQPQRVNKPTIKRRKKFEKVDKDEMVRRIIENSNSSAEEKVANCEKYKYSTMKSYYASIQYFKNQLKKKGINWKKDINLDEYTKKKKSFVWLPEDEKELLKLDKNGVSVGALANYFKLKPKQISDKLYILKKNGG